jgi:hypothetical protein
LQLFGEDDNPWDFGFPQFFPPMHPVAHVHHREPTHHNSRHLNLNPHQPQQRIPLLLHHNSPPVHKTSVARWKTQPSRHPGVHEAIFFADRNKAN